MYKNSSIAAGQVLNSTISLSLIILSQRVKSTKQYLIFSEVYILISQRNDGHWISVKLRIFSNWIKILIWRKLSIWVKYAANRKGRKVNILSCMCYVRSLRFENGPKKWIESHFRVATAIRILFLDIN